MTHDPNKTHLGWAPLFPVDPATAPPSAPQPGGSYPQGPGGSPPHDPAVPTPYAQGYAQPAYGPPAQSYGQPSSAHPTYAQPAHAQPSPGPSVYGPPSYAQPSYDQQACAQQAYAQQAYPYMGYMPQPGSAPPISAAGSHGHAAPQQQAAIAPVWQSTSAPVASAAPPGPAGKAKRGARAIGAADATAGVSDRVQFIRRTYLHLLGAIVAFAGLLYLLMTNDFLVANISVPVVRFALGGRWNWGVVLAAFMVVSWLADYWASHATSRGMQYVGLAAYVIAEALIFVPLLAIVAWKTQAILAKGGGDPNIIRDSAFVTLGIFTALTASVFVTKKDFSFLRSGLAMVSGAAVMLIVLSLTFGFNLGLAFSVAMVLLAAAYILYQTSQVLAHYDPSQHVAASLALFSSVALMFWYVIRIFMRARA
ncbi:MAG: Bax inhibitor-1 family protein [Myxococcota bacterium]|nr:Bax inhibitor-1 family protein [Myxococcota bacterium]